jgi:hypothetical protein
MMVGAAPIPCNETISGAAVFFDTFDEAKTQYCMSWLASAKW